MSELDFLVREPAEIKALLEGARTVAVVGLSSDPVRPSFGVAGVLLEFGYEIFPVNPNEASIHGKRSFDKLSDVPVAVDIVDLFRRSSEVGQHVDEAIACGAKAVWLQDGVIDEAAAKRAHAAGLRVVMNRCMARDLVKFFGSPPLPGRV